MGTLALSAPCSMPLVNVRTWLPKPRPQIQIALTSAEDGVAVNDFVVLAISAHHAPAIRAMVAALGAAEEKHNG